MSISYRDCAEKLQQPSNTPSSPLAPPLPHSHMLSVAALVQLSEGLSQMAKYNWVYNNLLNVFIGAVDNRNACETTASAWLFFI